MGACQTKKSLRKTQNMHKSGHKGVKETEKCDTTGSVSGVMDKKNLFNEEDQMQQFQANAMILVSKNLSKETKTTKQQSRVLYDSEKIQYAYQPGSSSIEIIEQEEGTSNIEFYSSRKPLEFMIGKKIGGPLVVPMISYNQICHF